MYSIDGAGIEYTIDLKCRPNGLAFLDNNTVAVGGENTKVQVNIYLLSSNLWFVCMSDHNSETPRPICLKFLLRNSGGAR